MPTLIIGLVFLAPLARGEEPPSFPPDRPVVCTHIKLELTVDVEHKNVQGRASIDLTARRAAESVRFDAVDMDVTKVALGRKGKPAAPARFTNDGKLLTISCDPPLAAGEKVQAVIDYSLTNPTDGLHFFGPTDAEPDAPYVVWSQGESITNRYWFPCFDHPSGKQTSELIVTAKAGNEIISNGKLVEKKEDKQAGTVTAHWVQDKPHSAYLITLVVGPFAMIEDTWRGKPVRCYCRPIYQERLKRSFAHTKGMLDFFSEKTGVEYPWDQYAQIVCYGYGGGMENTSATTMGERVLYDERGMLDGDPDGLIAHEMAHQWWGDLLTCNDWAHTWLNEGFASYFDPLWTEHQFGEDEFAYAMYRNAGSAIRGGREKPIVYRRYGSPDTQFDSRAYPKGSWVLHMLRRLVGDDTFFKALHRYATEHAYQNVETADLRRAFEAETGRNLERFFYDWTERPGCPVLDVRCDWNPDGKRETVRVQQTQKDDAFCFPLTVEFRTAGGSPVVVRRDISSKEETIEASLPDAPTMVRIDPDNALLCELNETKGRDLWAAQLTGDPNPVGRIRAAKHLATTDTDRDRTLLAKALQSEKFWAVQREIAQALSDAGGPLARDGLIAGLPLSHPKARRACVEQLGDFIRDPKVIAALRPLVEKGDPSCPVEAAAIEAYGKVQPDAGLATLKPLLSRESRYDTIRAAVLAGIGHLHDPASVDLLIEWTRRGKSTQARAAAIEALGETVRYAVIDDAATRKAVDALVACVAGESRNVQFTTVEALDALGGVARPALPMLESVKITEHSRRFRQEMVTKAIEHIRSGAAPRVELSDVRDKLRKLEVENDELRERLAAIDGKPAAKTPHETKAGSGPPRPRSRRQN